MKKQIGMTLIELMIVTIILAIMASVAVPSMRSMFDNNSIKVVGPIFEKSIQYARSEAKNRPQVVRMTPKNGATDNDWSQGWNISIVTGPNPEDIELIKTFDALPGTPVFVSDTFTTNTPLDFRSDGQVSLIGSFSLNLSGCSGGKKYIYNVMISGILSRSVTSCQ